MYAIVEIAGQQFKAEKGRKLYVHRLAESEGSAVSCRLVMLLERDGKVRVGAPILEDATVEIEVLRHLKDDKVIIFKKNRRKGYRVKNGHRQCLTQVLITDILEGQAPATKEAPKKAAKPAAPKAAVVAPEVVATPVVEKAPKVAAAPKAAAPKKPAAPKAATPKAAKEVKPAAKKPAAPKTKKTE